MKAFYEMNKLIAEELSRYAPTDEKLLSIPFHMTINDPLFKLIIETKPSNERNYFLMGARILNFLQLVNVVLSRVYAAYQWVAENYNKPINPSLKQTEVDYEVFKKIVVMNQYSYSMREFILMLKVAIDQIILLITSDVLKYPDKCDCIGTFLGKYDNSNCVFDKRFLRGLNAAARSNASCLLCKINLRK